MVSASGEELDGALEAWGWGESCTVAVQGGGVGDSEWLSEGAGPEPLFC